MPITMPSLDSDDRARVTRRELVTGAAVLSFAMLAGPAKAAESTPLRRVYVQPLGSGMPATELAFIRTSLLAFYDVEVVLLERAALPQSAFYAPRKRYRAERLLTTLDRIVPKDGYRILGVTDVDISTTKGAYADWGVMGLGSMDGRTCVLSSFRCRRGAKNDEHATIRMGKTAVHEIGHTFGLPHCPNRGCLMEDGHGTVFTSDREYDLCSDSRLRLIETGHVLAHERAIPWPKP
jgi:archaemetzincin